MTVHRLLQEADSLELERWRRFLKADADEQQRRRDSDEIERRLNGSQG